MGANTSANLACGSGEMNLKSALITYGVEVENLCF